MIQNPFLISGILLAIITIAYSWHERWKDTAVMRFLPTPILCYIPPTLLTTIGVLPYKSPVYDWISTYVLPACLILLLMTTDLDGLKKIGRLALITILGSSLAVLLSGAIVFFLFRDVIGIESWKATAVLAASWVGGTANQLAVKEAIGFSDQLFVPLFIADITVVYIWMTVLMVLSPKQIQIDRFFKANTTQLQIILGKEKKTKSKKQLTIQSVLILLIVGFGIGNICGFIGNQIPEFGMAITKITWVILIVTTVGLLLSLTKFAQKEKDNAVNVGYFLFYLVLASTGAKAHLLAIVKAPFFMIFSLVWVFIYGILMTFLGRAFRIPVALLATASQANLGGVVSAPIVASTYNPKLIPIGVILAIFGYAISNYVCIIYAQILSLFA